MFSLYLSNLFQLFEPTECGNGYVEAGEECDCGIHVVSIRNLFYFQHVFYPEQTAIALVRSLPHHSLWPHYLYF